MKEAVSSLGKDTIKPQTWKNIDLPIVVDFNCLLDVHRTEVENFLRLSDEANPFGSEARIGTTQPHGTTQKKCLLYKPHLS